MPRNASNAFPPAWQALQEEIEDGDTDEEDGAEEGDVFKE